MHTLSSLRERNMLPMSFYLYIVQNCALQSKETKEIDKIIKIGIPEKM